MLTDRVEVGLGSLFEQFFRDYGAAFDAFDAERVAAYYNCPCLMVTNEHVASFTTEEAIRANMRSLLEHHRAQEVGRAEVSEFHVDVQGESLAIVRVRWNILDRKNAPLWNWLNTYNLVDHGAGWKILVSTTHTESTSDGAGDGPR